MPTLGSFIRRRREELGLTQEQLAELVGEGVRQAEISRLENDRVTLPRRQRLERIAQALDVPVGTLLAKSGWTGAEEIDNDELELSAAVSSDDSVDRAMETTEFLRSVLDGIDEGVAVIDADGTIVMSNETYGSYAKCEDPAAVFFDGDGRVVASAERWFGPVAFSCEEESDVVSIVRENERISYEVHGKPISVGTDQTYRIVTVKFCEDDCD